MKLRTDLAGLALVAVLVAAIVALTLAGQPVPELLTTAAAAALTYAVGAATPTTVGGAGTAAPAENLERDPAPARAVAVLPTPAAAAPASVLPAPRPRDVTETFPAITAAQIAADKAAQA